MNVLEAALTRLAADLDDLGVGWALVGGFAVAVRCEPRFTRDIDVAVLVADDDQAESIVAQLVRRGYGVDTTVEQEYVDRLAAVRLRSPVMGGVVTDLLFASSGIEPEIARSAERMEVVPGLVLPVATTAHLVLMKLLARDDVTRPQDAADLVALRRVATERDVVIVAQAIALVVDRGFTRDRDLRAALTAWW